MTLKRNLLLCARLTMFRILGGGGGGGCTKYLWFPASLYEIINSNGGMFKL